MTADVPDPPFRDQLAVRALADQVYDGDVFVTELVEQFRRDERYCCSVGCGSGACETCPCCGAGWCVSGVDGLPEDPEDRALWLEIAAEHNPVAAELARVPDAANQRAEFHRAGNAEERGEGICRTCLAPIWNEGGTVAHRKRAEGWSDRIERGGDSLVCFKARDYRHVPLTDREAAIYDHAATLAPPSPSPSPTSPGSSA